MSAASDFLLARQPIYDRKLDVHGYELLSQELGKHSPSTGSGLVELDDESWTHLTGGRLAYVRADRADDAFVARLKALGGEQVVPELDCAHDPACLETARMLRDSGLRIALNNFKGSPDEAALLPLASVIKIDLRKTSPDKLEELVQKARQNRDALLLAAKVDTHEQKEQCLMIGFDLLEGYFLSRPAAGHREPPASRIAVLQLLAALQNPDATVSELETIISRDAGMSYHLLRIANSAIFHLPRRIESLKQAINMLGLRLIRSWATLIGMARIDDQPNELMVTALVRARMCELLGGLGRIAEPEQLFTVGMFSILDALLDRPMKDVLSDLPLSPDVATALLHHDGNSGKTLGCVLCWETGDWESLDWDFIEGFGLSEDRMSQTYLDAVRWANDCRHQLSSMQH